MFKSPHSTSENDRIVLYDGYITGGILTNFAAIVLSASLFAQSRATLSTKLILVYACLYGLLYAASTVILIHKAKRGFVSVPMTVEVGLLLAAECCVVALLLFLNRPAFRSILRGILVAVIIIRGLLFSLELYVGLVALYLPDLV